MSAPGQNSIDEQLAACRYGRYNLLERPPTVIVNPRTNAACIQDALHLDDKRLDGTCLELSIALGRRLASADSQHVYLCIGNDNKYFAKLGEQHCFLARSPQNKPLSGDPTTWANTAAELIDPSFQRRMPFREASYRINDAIDVWTPLTLSRDVMIGENEMLPIGFDDDSLVSVGFTQGCHVSLRNAARLRTVLASHASQYVQDPALRAIIDTLCASVTQSSLPAQRWVTI